MKTLKLLLAALALCAGPLSSRANTVTVTSLADDGTSGTLRGAIQGAASGGTINFAVTGTILLTNTIGELAIGRNLTITGPGAKLLAINGNAASGVFNIGSVTVNISGLTITNGSASQGGGIYNNGTLTLANCLLSGNSAADGGGIYNNSTLTLANCTLSANSANASTGGGGGIENWGTLTLTACTLSGNSTTGLGGGILNYFATLTLTACTLSGNSAGAGGGLIVDGGTATVGNTIIAGNTGFAPDVDNGVNSAGYNLIGDTTGSRGWGTNDQTGTYPSTLNPFLGPLTDNGGPTATMAPQAGSAAIDNGNSFGLTTDQRGLPRPVEVPGYPNASGGDGSDIGAFEVQTMRNIGLRAYDGKAIIPIACQESGALTSPLRISKNGTTYGILLVPTNFIYASRMRIQTSSGTMALGELP
ncbi:MAG: choice-of-anchor Q domain-containing protein [Verrucomicrobiota bacterium]|jgi:hypothetical protein